MGSKIFLFVVVIIGANIVSIVKWLFFGQSRYKLKEWLVFLVILDIVMAILAIYKGWLS